MNRFILALVVLASLAAAPFGALAQMGMPDVRAMSGIPRPDDSLPDGTISVRVGREDLSNILAGHPVELVVDGQPRSARSDETGHAKFPGLTPGSAVKAATTIDGERIESEEFRVPRKGGVVLMLVGGAPGGAAAPPASSRPVPGIVVLGGQSRVELQFADDQLQVFYLFEIVNTARHPVSPPTPVVLDLPGEAEGASILEGSSPQATVGGGRVTVAGPFKPGTTLVQVAYALPPGNGRVQIAQKVPAAVPQVLIVAQKLEGLKISSPQITNTQDVTSDGQTFILGSGPAVQAGGTIAFEVSGLPHRSAAPRFIALGLALVIVALGGWAAFRAGDSGARSGQARLRARRDELFAAVLRLDEEHQRGRLSEGRYEARRAGLMAELERIYGELDAAAHGPKGSDEGLAA